MKPAFAAAPSPELDQLRETFRTAYHEYMQAGQQSEHFLSELKGRTQRTDDLQILLDLQTAESRALSRYNEARMAYVSAVFKEIV
ncbi:MAG TPA: hypothetical protein VFL57_14765 [Bryobacteraceae bacterium]|nr:hypothetical protein [Bryobacteraceae bacterium]